MLMNKQTWIWFDMDGTFVDLYSVPNWLGMLRAYDPTPYRIAKPLVRLSQLARLMNILQSKGYKLGIISWSAKNSTPEYDKLVEEAKKEYLDNHMPSVCFDAIHVVPYGTSKENFNNGADFLFDDEAQNLDRWTGEAYHASKLIETLQELIRG